MNAALGQLARARLQLVQALLPGGGGVGLVEPQGVREGVPQALDVGLAERLARPALGRIGDERPRELAAHDAVHPHQVEVAEAGAREPVAVEALEDLGARVGRDADHGRADLDRPLEALHHPRRRPAEHLVGRRRDERALDPAVGVGDVDVARAGGVGLLGDRPHERRVLVLGVDEQLLALGEVDPGADEQAGVGAQARLDVVGHVSS